MRVMLVDLDEVAATWRQAGHVVECLDSRTLSAPWPLDGPPAAAAAYRVYLALRDHPVDTIGFPASGGLAFYALLARRHGIAFDGTGMWLGARTGVARQGEPVHPDVLETAFMERRCAELADTTDVSGPEAAEAPIFRAAPDGARPLVSVCLAHYERPALLDQALDSLRIQDYHPLEVILTDDGSESPAARARLDSLAPEFATRGWTLIRQTRRYAGAAYNSSARHAKGEYLLFMDDDNCARPGEIALLVRAAVRSDADILTCCFDVFRGAEPPGPATVSVCRKLFTGSVVAGLFRNAFGDTNALVRRSVFEALGGFTEDFGVSYDDWEFFAKAVLHGFRLEVVPEPAFWYRLSEISITTTTDHAAGHRRRLRPYREALPPGLDGLADLSFALYQQAALVPQLTADLARARSSRLHHLFRRLFPL